MINRIRYTLLLLLILTGAAQASDTLRSMLPANTLAYLRIVGPDGFSGAAPGTALDQALTAAQQDAPAQIRQGLLANLAADPQALQEGAVLELLLGLRAPIEAALLSSPGGALQAAKLLVRGRLDADSIEAVNALLQRLADGDPKLDLAEPLDADGTGMMVAKRAIPMVVHFDPDGQWFYLMSGLTADRQGFADTLASLKMNTPDRAPASLAALEQRVDSSGQGPLLWLDVPTLVQSLAATNPQMAMAAQSVRMSGVRGAALGWGTRDGKGRLSLVLDAPRANGMTQMLPAILNDLSLTSRGQPGLLFSMNIPGPALLRIAEGILAASPENNAKYQAGKQRLETALGLSVGQLVATVGPEMLLFNDDLGTFFAMRIGDHKALGQLMQGITVNPGIDYQVREIDGRQYHHLAFTETPSTKASTASDDGTEQGALVAYYLQLKQNTRTHLYWVEDGDWLVFGQLPQSLFDRNRSADPVVIGDWLRDQQKQDSKHSVLLFSAQWEDIPRSLYYTYLQVLEAAADIAGTPIDLFTRPGAVELQFPETGSYGLQLDLADPFLSLELSFEANPLEFVFGTNSMTTIAVAGILAAVAIPAYQDYVVRATVGLGLAEMQQAKSAVLMVYLANGYLPADRAEAGLSSDPTDVNSDVLDSLVIDHGRITITFGDNAPATLQGKTLSLTPYGTGNGLVTWRCGNAELPTGAGDPLLAKDGQSAEYLKTDIAHRQLPANCR